MPRGTIEWELIKKPETTPFDSGDFEAHLKTQFPTLSFIALNKKRNSLRQQKSKAKLNTNLNVFERTQKMDAFQRKIDIVDKLMQQASAQMQGGENAGSE